jgi:hypothetical protein
VAQSELEIVPRRPGRFNVRARIVVAGRAIPSIEAGGLEVVGDAGVFTPYRDVVPVIAAVFTSLGALAGTLVTLFLTLRKQGEILAETRRQKAADAVAQIVLHVVREYYGAIGGATSALAIAVRRLRGETTPEERQHLLVRAFFFFGTVLHKDNEFAFSQGLLFLPDLWAEADMRRMIDELLELVPLTHAQEAVVHKCFSDVARAQRTNEATQGTIKARNLYEVEKLLVDRVGHTGEDHRRVQEVFDAVKERFADPDVIEGIDDIDRAMHALMEFEFTIMFSDFYRRDGASEGHASGGRVRRARGAAAPRATRRDRPDDSPAFDEIVRDPTWRATREILERIEERRDRRRGETISVRR